MQTCPAKHLIFEMVCTHVVSVNPITHDIFTGNGNPSKIYIIFTTGWTVVIIWGRFPVNKTRKSYSCFSNSSEHPRLNQIKNNGSQSEGTEILNQINPLTHYRPVSLIVRIENSNSKWPNIWNGYTQAGFLFIYNFR